MVPLREELNLFDRYAFIMTLRLTARYAERWSLAQRISPENFPQCWARVDMPVLAIFGTSEFVTERADHERIVDVVNSRHSGSAMFVPISNMDHLLSPRRALRPHTMRSPQERPESTTAT